MPLKKHITLDLTIDQTTTRLVIEAQNSNKIIRQIDDKKEKRASSCDSGIIMHAKQY